MGPVAKAAGSIIGKRVEPGGSPWQEDVWPIPGATDEKGRRWMMATL